MTLDTYMDRLLIPLTRFKVKRWLQWVLVLAIELRAASLTEALQIFWAMLKQVRHLPLNRQLWRLKMRRCLKCPIYDPSLKRCRPYTGSNLGCGCYMPFAALVKVHGWATEQALTGKPIQCVLCW